ncbi:MAG: hypothetical protein FJX61_16815 [Alphaproteobacteria bacterium]|nr:hypothetical protein [Alphaproteobacteria bacterium]
MEISPVAGIRVMPVVKTPPADSELSAFFDIEATARSGDDTYSRGAKKAAGAEEDEPEERGEELEAKPTAEPKHDSGGVSYFA